MPLASAIAARSQRPSSARIVAAGTSRKRRVFWWKTAKICGRRWATILKSSGHDVTLAADGLEGLSRELDSSPDVLLIDVGLPGMDGYDLARRLRSDPAGQSLFLVALTGYGGPEAKRSAQEAGFDLHLTKPVSNDELQRVLDRELPVTH